MRNRTRNENKILAFNHIQIGKLLWFQEHFSAALMSLFATIPFVNCIPGCVMVRMTVAITLMKMLKCVVRILSQTLRLHCLLYIQFIKLSENIHLMKVVVISQILAFFKTMCYLTKLSGMSWEVDGITRHILFLCFMALHMGCQLKP